MKEIFSDLYNKVLGFFQSEKSENTKVTATNRLKLVLLHDRTNLDTITMQKMREQLVNVISRYIEIDQEALDLNLEGEGDSIALMLNIPVIRARTKEEIEELETAEEEAKKAEIMAQIEEQSKEFVEQDEADGEETEDSENSEAKENEEEVNEKPSEIEDADNEQQKIDFGTQDDQESQTAQEDEEQSPSEEASSEPSSKKKKASKK